LKRDFKKKTYLAKMGFALVEVILATAILSAGLLMIVRVFPLGLKIEQKVERYSTASLLGQTLIEELKRGRYDDLSEAFPEAATDHGIGEGEFKECKGYSYEVEWWETPVPNLRKVRVRVLYRKVGAEAKNSPRQYLELVTYLAR
jgi:type II secretory pathway component PulJ